MEQEVMATPMEAFNRMFIISVGEFTFFFKKLNQCKKFDWLGKGIFVLFELIVTVMLINMLIATMGRTYQQVAETRKEYKRQRAQVILLLEQGLTPKDRLLALLKYSRPVGTNKAKRAFVVVSEMSGSLDDAVQNVQSTQQIAQPVILKLQNGSARQYSILVEDQKLDVGGGASAALRHLIHAIYVLRISYPREIKYVYNFFEHIFSLDRKMGPTDFALFSECDQGN